ncbi:hypothetical protein ACJX0J_021525, partial [Zea mays]
VTSGIVGIFIKLELGKYRFSGLSSPHPLCIFFFGFFFYIATPKINVWTTFAVLDVVHARQTRDKLGNRFGQKNNGRKCAYVLEQVGCVLLALGVPLNHLIQEKEIRILPVKIESLLRAERFGRFWRARWFSFLFYKFLAIAITTRTYQCAKRAQKNSFAF